MIILRLPFLNVNLAHPTRFSLRNRLLVAVVGLVLLAPLLTATRLQPSPRGLGTHQQLGLPPCTIRALFGMRCPSCGMTTSWAYAVRGQLWASAKTNVGGALLAVLTMAAVPWWLASAVRGTWLTPFPSDNTLACGAVVVVLVTLADWAWRLHYG